MPRISPWRHPDRTVSVHSSSRIDLNSVFECLDLWPGGDALNHRSPPFFPAAEAAPRAPTMAAALVLRFAAAVPVRTAPDAWPSWVGVDGNRSRSRTGEKTMPAIGYVAKDENGGFKGQLKTLSIRAEISIVPNARKKNGTQPDFRVRSGDVEIGAGWMRRSEASGRDYVSLSLAAPEF